VIRALVVDDEPLAREGICVRLKDEAGVRVVGEACDGPDAVAGITRLQPDLVFLDIQIPGFDGFEVLERVAPVHLPAVVFVTAYDRYAVQAFEAQAVDYLLKPINARRFHQALQQVRRRLERDRDEETTQERLCRLLELRAAAAPGTSARYSPWFTVRDGHRFLVVKADEIDWIDSASNYVQLHARGRPYLLRMTMNQLEDRLDPQHFVRIHRTTIVNVDRVAEIAQAWQSDFSVKLHDGTTLRMSRGYRDRLLR
jgi:two-component system LytT family response regulator